MPLDDWIICAPMERKIGRPRKADSQSAVRAQRKANIAVLDFETDPFDNKSKDRISPFAACLYSERFEPVVIWEENFEAFVTAVLAAMEALPEAYTIYAHSGGRFDYMFLIHKLRGAVMFKGSGLMSVKFDRHELRDSFHIIPDSLSEIQKDDFDYKWMHRTERASHRQQIIEYMIHDCQYLYGIVKAFRARFGAKLTIGQAAMAEVGRNYSVKRFSEGFDKDIREFYFGGRVQCLQGRGKFTGAYKLFDVNSEYPYVMATRQHPIGDFCDYTVREGGPVREDTIFIKLECDNRNALVGRDDEGHTTTEIPHGVFKTTIFEFEVACRYGLISNVNILRCYDCKERTDFSKFVLPLYDMRLQTKRQLDLMKKAGDTVSAKYFDTKKDDTFYKLILNNCYGKFAINPRRYKEHYITDPGEYPPDEWMKSIADITDPVKRFEYEQPLFECDLYWIWHKPNPRWNFRNVGVAASITGAARALLLEGIQHATDPIYCDTDSIICRDLSGVAIDKVQLGAWDLEDTFSEVLITGKKLYGVKHSSPKARTQKQIDRGMHSEYTIKSKGTAGITWAEMESILDGAIVAKKSFAPSFDRYGGQEYITRRIRATAERR